ncbi:dipeptidase [Streptomyces albus]|uniref:Dipeptidase n=1 Tax=Streptomyces albus TaxID=1888 RepID=A0A8H1L2I8_9ACTN|nr:dipeptidase [Streptomyces albus]MDI6412234.1 dipeptidase [Streptomyces albus]TGG76262.1 dipeptidase [Streptomyces albus]
MQQPPSDPTAVPAATGSSPTGSAPAGSGTGPSHESPGGSAAGREASGSFGGSAAAAGVANTVAALMPRAKSELAELVAFRSVADPEQFPRSECEGAAEWIARALRAEGFQDVATLDTPDGTQSVYGFLPGPEGAPTVLLYAHYDVQPPLDEAAWRTPPFELTDGADGRWYGRGAADCKGGFIMHLLALRAVRENGGLPVSVKMIVEGSEEQGTGGLEEYARSRPELLAADAIVIGDAGNFRCGLPTVTATLRGMALLRVQVDTLEGNLHSGLFGGAAPDALAALLRTLDSLRDADGNTVIDGLEAGAPWEGMPYPEEDFRQDAKVLDGVGLLGSGAVADRLWARPAVTVLGIDCPPVVGATPSVHASARALVSLRIPPGTDVEKAVELLVAHVESHVPWQARVTTELVGKGQPFSADTTSPAYSAMAEALRAAYDGQEMQISGMGGSIPLCNALDALYPEAEILLIGLSEPEAQIHAVNESVDPRELERMAVAEALFLRGYAAQAAG